jgi:hypothetical protein
MPYPPPPPPVNVYWQNEEGLTTKTFVNGPQQSRLAGSEDSVIPDPGPPGMHTETTIGTHTNAKSGLDATNSHLGMHATSSPFQMHTASPVVGTHAARPMSGMHMTSPSFGMHPYLGTHIMNPPLGTHNANPPLGMDNVSPPSVITPPIPAVHLKDDSGIPKPSVSMSRVPHSSNDYSNEGLPPKPQSEFVSSSPTSRAEGDETVPTLRSPQLNQGISHQNSVDDGMKMSARLQDDEESAGQPHSQDSLAFQTHSPRKDGKRKSRWDPIPSEQLDDEERQTKHQITGTAIALKGGESGEMRSLEGSNSVFGTNRDSITMSHSSSQHQPNSSFIQKRSDDSLEQAVQQAVLREQVISISLIPSQCMVDDLNVDLLYWINLSRKLLYRK